MTEAATIKAGILAAESEARSALDVQAQVTPAAVPDFDVDYELPVPAGDFASLMADEIRDLPTDRDQLAYEAAHAKATVRTAAEALNQQQEDAAVRETAALVNYTDPNEAYQRLHELASTYPHRAAEVIESWAAIDSDMAQDGLDVYEAVLTAAQENVDRQRETIASARTRDLEAQHRVDVEAWLREHPDARHLGADMEQLYADVLADNPNAFAGREPADVLAHLHAAAVEQRRGTEAIRVKAGIIDAGSTSTYEGTTIDGRSLAIRPAVRVETDPSALLPRPGVSKRIEGVKQSIRGDQSVSEGYRAFMASAPPPPKNTRTNIPMAWPS